MHPLPPLRGLPYPANGFFCWGRDGKCLRSEMRRLNAPDRQVAQEVKEEISR